MDNVRFLPSQPVSEAALRLLSQYGDPPTVMYLEFSGSGMTDALLPYIAKLENLERLHLANTAITDAGLAQLQGLNKLQALDVSNTAITDAGLAQLQGLKELGWLGVSNTQVTPQGVADFHRALPNCQLDVPLSPAPSALALPNPAPTPVCSVRQSG